MKSSVVLPLFYFAAVIIATLIVSSASAQETNTPAALPSTQSLQSQISSTGALLTVIGLWLMRELTTLGRWAVAAMEYIGSQGGVIGLFNYFLRGVRVAPSTISPVVPQPPSTSINS